MFRKSRVLLAAALIAAALLAGCSTHTKIADIIRDPGNFVGKDVTIAGNVSESFSALGNGFFQMDDGSGGMWVYSQNFGVPGNGSKVELPVALSRVLRLAAAVSASSAPDPGPALICDLRSLRMLPLPVSYFLPECPSLLPTPEWFIAR